MPLPAVKLPTQTPLVADSVVAQPEQKLNQQAGEVTEIRVTRNDTLERLFRRARLSLDDLAVVRDLPGMRDSLDALKPDETITIAHNDGSLLKLTRRLSDTELLEVTREPQGFATKVLATPLEMRVTATRGAIESSLFNDARAAGLSSGIIMRLANDVFGWDIDFALEIQTGDQFGVIYEQKYRDSEYLGDGRILAAEFVNNGRMYRAVHFRSADGVIDDYFAPNGNSMRKQFLRAPVDFKYVSSNFSLRRLHPILNVVRAHQGVDYSAPIGTPVKAAGDGRVSQIGAQGGYGNAIVLEHGGGISTLYGHLSNFAKNLRSGVHVKQGDVIGFVGSTGAATGAHLHYEYRINGVHKNPRSVGLPDAQPIPSLYVPEFEEVKTSLIAQLDVIKAPRVATRP